jgi:hypothetical protein
VSGWVGEAASCRGPGRPLTHRHWRAQGHELLIDFACAGVRQRLSLTHGALLPSGQALSGEARKPAAQPALVGEAGGGGGPSLADILGRAQALMAATDELAAEQGAGASS